MSTKIQYPHNLKSENVKSIVRIRSFDYQTPVNNDEAVQSDFDGDTPGNQTSPVTSINPSEVKTEIKIASPMQLQSNYSMSYNEQGRGIANTLAAPLLGGIKGGKQALERVFRGAINATLPFVARELEIDSGAAVNPMTVLMFNGPTHRQFSLNFVMKPKDETDADMMLAIINQLKLGSHPSVSGGGEAGTFEQGVTVPLWFNYPDFYVLDFMYQDENSNEWKPNPHIYASQRCFLESINISYHNAGTQSYFKKNGIPTAVGLAVNFKEYNVITREHIKRQENSGLGMNSSFGGV